MWTNRQAQIIEILLKNTSGITGSYLGAKLSVSARTVRNDIFFINNELKPYNCSIYATNKRGYYIKQEQAPLISSLLNHFKQVVNKSADALDRQLMMIGILIFEENQDLDSLSERLFVSTQTVYKDLSKFQKSVKAKMHCNLFDITSHSIKVMQDESLIRKFFLLMIKDEVHKCSNLFGSRMIYIFGSYYDEKKLKSLVAAIKDEFGTNHLILSDELLFLIVWAVYFSILRNQTGHLLTKKSNENKSDKKIMDVMMNLSQSLEDFYINDIDFLDHFMWTLKLYDASKGDYNAVKEHGRIINDFCREVNLKYGFDLRHSEELMKILTAHIEFMMRRLQTGYEYENPVKNFIKEKYAFAYEIAMLIVPIVFQYKKKYLLDGEVSYIAIYIEYHMEELYKCTKVLLISRYDTAIAQITKNWLLNNFPNKIEIVDVIPVHLLNEYLKEHAVDLIISLSTMVATEPIPVYVIDELPLLTDRMKIHEVLNRIHIGHRYEIAVQNKFSRNLTIFYQDGKELTFEQVIRDMSRKLYQNGNIEDLDGFASNILLREENYPTLLSNAFMIPHPLGTFSKRTGVSAAIFKSPVKVHGKDIRLIFTLAIEAKFDTEVNDLFKLFNQIAINKTEFEKLVECNDFKSFEEALTKFPTTI